MRTHETGNYSIVDILLFIQYKFYTATWNTSISS